MSITNGAATLKYELQSKEVDEESIECRLMSKESKDGAFENVDSQEGGLECPYGIDIAYHVYLRRKAAGLATQ